MAKARPTQKRRRIIISKPKEDKGDIQISAGEAKLRLTPKLFLTFFLLIAAAVSIVMLAARRSSTPLPSSASAIAARSGEAVQAGVATAPNRLPQVVSAAIIPPHPDASQQIDVRYETIDPDGDPVTSSIRWFVNDSMAQEGSTTVLSPGSYRTGDVVYAEVTPADPTGQGASFRTDPITIGSSAPTAGGVTITPESPSIGDVLTAAPTGVPAASGTLINEYHWFVNGDEVPNGSGRNTFDTRNLKKRDSVSVAMTVSDGKMTSGSVRSNMVFIQNRKPEITSQAPESLQGTSYSYQVAAKDPDGDVLKFRLERAPAGMTINETTGSIQWALKKDTMYAGRNEAAVRVTVDDGDGGTASQDFTIVFTDLYVQ